MTRVARAVWRRLPLVPVSVTVSAARVVRELVVIESRSRPQASGPPGGRPRTSVQGLCARPAQRIALARDRVRALNHRGRAADDRS